MTFETAGAITGNSFLKSGVDETMTTALREKIREERGPLNFYEFGKARDAYQARWLKLHDAICDTISLPTVQRQISFSAIYEEINARLKDNRAVKPGDVSSIHSEILSRAADRGALPPNRCKLTLRRP